MPFCGKGFDASPRAPVNDADASVRQSDVSERSPTWSIGTVDFWLSAAKPPLPFGTTRGERAAPAAADWLVVA